MNSMPPCPVGYDCTFGISVHDPQTGLMWLAFGLSVLIAVILIFAIYRLTGGR